jgi:uncharacterized membrane protein
VAPIRWTKPALAARLQHFEERFRGDELVDAVVTFADELEPEDRELLQDVLLERAGEQRRIAPLIGRRSPK